MEYWNGKCRAHNNDFYRDTLTILEEVSGKTIRCYTITIV